jgi:PleD family two-component response regulator
VAKKLATKVQRHEVAQKNSEFVSKKMKTSIFIVDDHYMVIEGIRSLLQNEKGIEWTGHATNAASCLGFLKNQQRILF